MSLYGAEYLEQVSVYITDTGPTSIEYSLQTFSWR